MFKKIIFVLLPIFVSGFQNPILLSKTNSVKQTVMYGRNRNFRNYGNSTGDIGPFIIPIHFQRDEPEEDKTDLFHSVKDKLFNFTKIGGYQEIKEELLQMKDLFDNVSKYKQYDIRIPRGLLLEGPPGNGKTLLAKCFAGECNYNFISCSGSEFTEKYVGVGASRIRDLFKSARKQQPSIIFIDELDAIGGKRDQGTEGSSAERYQTLNQLLVLMDGFSTDKDKIFIMGATNRKDMLDPALLRSGRFDKIIHVPNPDPKTRQEILKIHLKRKPISHELEHSDNLVDLTAGMSGADIENMINEASLYGLRTNKIPVDLNIMERTRDRILLGYTMDKNVLSEKDAYRISVHECGHLLASMACDLHEKVSKITIMSSSPDSLGYTFFDTNDRIGLYSKEYLIQKIMTLMGGKIAESLIFDGNISSGAAEDLRRVADIAEKMITSFGMGTINLYSKNGEINKNMIDLQIQELIMLAAKRLESIFKKNRKLLEFWSESLVDKKTMNKYEIHDTMKQALFLFPSNDFTNY